MTYKVKNDTFSRELPNGFTFVFMPEWEIYKVINQKGEIIQKGSLKITKPSELDKFYNELYERQTN